jgi:exonuclease III
MRLLVWNMAAGFGYDPERHERAWLFLQRSDPDVALLQEAVVPPWATERWRFVLGSRRYPPVSGRSDVAWGSAIIARDDVLKAFVPTGETPFLGKLRGAVVVAMTAGPASLWFASIHSNAYPLSPDAVTSDALAGVPRCDPKDIWEIEVIAHELSGVFGSHRFIAGGDLNSGLLFDTRYGRQSNARLFANLASLGFVDLRKAFHESEQRTYFKEGKGPYQLDHVFSDTATAATARGWRVLSEVAAVEGLSDHAPIEVVLDYAR